MDMHNYHSQDPRRCILTLRSSFTSASHPVNSFVISSLLAYDIHGPSYTVPSVPGKLIPHPTFKMRPLEMGYVTICYKTKRHDTVSKP